MTDCPELRTCSCTAREEEEDDVHSSITTGDVREQTWIASIHPDSQCAFTWAGAGVYEALTQRYLRRLEYLAFLSEDPCIRLSSYVLNIYINAEPFSWVGGKVKHKLATALCMQSRNAPSQGCFSTQRGLFCALASCADALFRLIKCLTPCLEKLCALWQHE